jgi:hypothetical protein
MSEDNSIQAGKILDTWCSQHGEHGAKTPHLYNGYRLICLNCHPESDPRMKDKQQGILEKVSA